MINSLNENQKEAALKTEGPVRIIAGPGSGKTRTLTAKIANILEKGLATQEEILVITFTNKAAGEIKERIQKQIGVDFNSVFTYHGWSAWFLRKEANRISINPDYKIIDATDQKQIVKESQLELSEEMEEMIDVKWRDAISKFTEINFGKQLTQNHYEQLIGKLYERYTSKKKEINAFDFDDLLIKVKEALVSYPEVAEIYKNKYKYILVDEFQDTNKVQYEILRRITDKNSNITVVGDPDQNIYSWRGADIDIILNFDKDYDNVKNIILKKNYRSTPQILDASNNLINNNEHRISFDIESVNSEGPQIKILEGYNRQNEAYKIVDEIVRLNAINSIKMEEIAVIFRSSFVSRELETTLISRNIPYKLIGGFKFFERKEVREVLSFLHFLVKKDDFSFKKIINIPAKGVGPSTIAKFEKVAAENGCFIWEAMEAELIKTPSRLIEFVEHTRFAIENIEDPAQISDVLLDYLDKIGYIKYYSEDEDRIENIRGIIKQIKIHFKNKNVRDEITNFLNNAALSSSSDEKTEIGQLTLITGHASKGMEYKAVIVMGVNEGVLPSSKQNTKKGIEEERRLFYVAMTRAKVHLIISYALGYNFSGIQNFPSRFIKELDITWKEYNYVDTIVEMPEGFTSDNKDIIPGDVIYHKSFGEGTVLIVDSSSFKASFKPSIGIKDLLIGHSSYYLKK